MDSEDARLDRVVSPVDNQSQQMFSSEPSRGVERGGKFEMLKEFYSKLLSAIFIDAKGVDEPVVILSNSEFNIFPLVQSIVTKEYKISAERFWHIARHNTQPPRETWRPRIQKNQVKSLSDTRYPNSIEEWLNLERVLLECSEGFLPELSADSIMMNVKEFVTNIRQVWKDQRRAGYKRMASDADVFQGNTGASGRVVAELPHVADTVPDTQKTGLLPSRQRMYSSSSSEERSLQHKVTPATLLVGGTEFTTTLATLMIVPESFFAKLIMASTGAHNFFIDRSDEVFGDVLRYLRAKRYGEGVETLPFTNETHGLELLHREASFYNLPELAHIVRTRLKKKPPRMHVVCLETPSVDQKSLSKEIQAMNEKANAIVERASEESSSSGMTSVRILSHAIDVESDDKHQGKKRAKLVMTIEISHGI